MVVAVRGGDGGHLFLLCELQGVEGSEMSERGGSVVHSRQRKGGEGGGRAAFKGAVVTDASGCSRVDKRGGDKVSVLDAQGRHEVHCSRGLGTDKTVNGGFGLLIARSGRPERDASDIVAFPVTRRSKRRMVFTTGFVTSRKTQPNKNHPRIRNFAV